MSERYLLRRAASRLVLSLVLMALASGCNLFGSRNRPQVPSTRPSPTRPMGRRTRTPLSPSPTKRLPVVSAVDADQLRMSCDKILQALARKDWSAATGETNRLGALWTRFKPKRTGTMSATEMKNFDARYAKLQKDVRAKNRASAMRSCRALKDTAGKMKS